MVYHKKTMKQESVTKALLFREFKHFTSSPGYMLYIGIFIAVNVVAGIDLQNFDFYIVQKKKRK